MTPPTHPQVFADCKTRGPVILKSSDTADLIEKLEDSQVGLVQSTQRQQMCGVAAGWGQLQRVQGGGTLHPCTPWIGLPSRIKAWAFVGASAVSGRGEC